MRRTLFGKSPELERLAPSRASIGDALLFDVVDQQSSANQTLAERRADGWTFAPWLLLAGHLVIAATLLIQDSLALLRGGLVSVFVPMAAAITLDLVAGVVLVCWRRMQLAPHTVGRLLCGYLATVGVLWTASSVAAGNLALNDPAFVTLAITTGFFIRSIVAVASPPLAMINAIVAVTVSLLFSKNPAVAFSIDLLAAVMVAYSVANTRESLSRGRRRLAAEWQAGKALNFVDEFENSGRGWF